MIPLFLLTLTILGVAEPPVAVVVATPEHAAIDLWQCHRRVAPAGQTCAGQLYRVDLERVAVTEVLIPAVRFDHPGLECPGAGLSCVDPSRGGLLRVR